MSKFKIGDKVKLKSAAKGYSQGLYNVVSEYPHGDWNGHMNIKAVIAMFPDDFELAVEPSTEKYHIHYDMIVAWAKDPSRVVQFYDDEYHDCGWKDIVGLPPMWHSNKKYRFKPTEPERVFPETSLTHDQVIEIHNNTNSAAFADALIAVANAAIKQYILDTEKNHG